MCGEPIASSGQLSIKCLEGWAHKKHHKILLHDDIAAHKYFLARSSWLMKRDALSLSPLAQEATGLRAGTQHDGLTGALPTCHDCIARSVIYNERSTIITEPSRQA